MGGSVGVIDGAVPVFQVPITGVGGVATIRRIFAAQRSHTDRALAAVRLLDASWAQSAQSLACRNLRHAHFEDGSCSWRITAHSVEAARTSPTPVQSYIFKKS